MDKSHVQSSERERVWEGDPAGDGPCGGELAGRAKAPLSPLCPRPRPCPAHKVPEKGLRTLLLSQVSYLRLQVLKEGCQRSSNPRLGVSAVQETLHVQEVEACW